MSAEKIDGKKISTQISEELSLEIKHLKEEHNATPGLAVVLVGTDPASSVYVNAKEKKCLELGIYSEKIVLPADTSQEELLKTVYKLNNDERIHGILVQSPLPSHIDEDVIIENISPAKDVDCFHSYNVGRILIGDLNGFLPCTPHGVLVLMGKYGIDTSGKHVVVIGRSNIVGKPLAAMLMQKAKMGNATVTICHSRTKNLSSFTRMADIVITALGKPNFLTADMIKENAVVMDVGINRVEDSSRKSGYRLTGDVAYDEVAEKASFVTPVPGGVGPMTIAMLMKNTLTACRKFNKIS